MRELPILFSGAMVRALLDGSKTQTRRVVKWLDLKPGINLQFSGLTPSQVGGAWVLESPTRSSHEWRCAQTPCPFGMPGDRLWVRETWQGPMWEEGRWDPDTDYQSPQYCEYRADGGPTPEYVDFEDNFHQGWKPSIHMPRWASRITLEVTGVRVERPQDISEVDAAAEGVESLRNEGEYWKHYLESTASCDALICLSARESFRTLWDSLAAPGSDWQAYPWVWVVEFKRAA
ncbi:hypothetical protein ACW9YV_27910 (plasmid) [Paraburkholderia strydomiana]